MPGARPLLFKLDAEQAHHFTLDGLARAYRSACCKKWHTHTCPTTLTGSSLARHPVGLAAGLDTRPRTSTRSAAPGLRVYPKTALRHPQSEVGNPKPRLFRVPEHQAAD